MRIEVPIWALCLTLVLSGSIAIAQTSSRDNTPPGYTREEWNAVKQYQMKQIDDSQKVSRDSPAMPKDPTTSEGICPQPRFTGGEPDVRSFWTPRWKSYKNVKLGAGNEISAFDMTDSQCIPKSYDLYVPNETAVAIEIKQDPVAKCTAVEAYSDNPVKDYGSVVTGVFTSTVLGGLGYWGPYPSRAQSKLTQVTLPSSGVRNTAATVTISCHADDQTSAVGVQQKFVLHYGSPDWLSASTGVLMSSLGKKIYGVNTTDAGTQSSDGTEATTSTIGVTSSSDMQFVPMAFLDLNWAGNEKNNLNAQLGVGINPNGSATQVEYFASPIAFATHHVYIGLGVHFARSERITGNFYRNEVVESSFTVPTIWEPTYKVGATISFKPY